MNRLTMVVMIMFVSSPIMLAQPVQFNDQALKAAVEAELGVTNPTAEDMLGLTYLSASSSTIDDLTGLEYAKNLERLHLGGNQISNLSPLSGLTSLELLTLSVNQISDLSPLSGLTNLKELHLNDNQISDISPLSGLTNLVSLVLYDNQISDISPLSGLTNLVYLVLFNNQISDLTPLAGLTNLTGLWLEDNQISDISPLAGLTDLGELYLNENPLNQEAYEIYIPQMEANGTWIGYDQLQLLTVPDVVGMSENDANLEITSVGLKVSHTYRHSDTVPEGHVISQYPSAWTSRVVGTYVELIVSLGPSIRGPYYVDARAMGNNDGTSWANAFKRLQDALAAVSAGDEIRVAQGIYKPDQGRQVTPGDRNATFRLINGVKIKGGYAGYGSPDPDMRNIILYETILSGDLAGNDRVVADPCDLLTEPTMAENSLHVVMAVNCDESTVLDGLTITAGNANLDTTPENRGAGLYNNPASLIVQDCTFTRNAASWFGAGMYNHWNSRSEPNVICCTFRENAVNGQGAGLYNHATCNPTLTECLFECNFAKTAGAAIKLGESRATVIGCRFINNHAESGGAIYAQNNDGGYVLTDCTFEGNLVLTHGGAIRDVNSVSVMTDCIFTSNAAGYEGAVVNGFTVGRGGAISIADGSSAYIARCRFTHNEAEVHGGAMFSQEANPIIADCMFIGNTAGNVGGAILTNTSPLSLMNCYVAGNTAAYGGAVYNIFSEAVYCGSVFSANAATQRGGAINNVHGTLPSYSVNCTFAGNSSGNSGGAIADVNSVHDMSNCILWDNHAPNGPQAAVTDFSMLTVNRCDVQNGESGIFVGGSLLKWGSGNIADDSLFVDVDGPDNIAGTEDDLLNLSAGSPCIDAGDNRSVMEDAADLDGDGDINERLPLDIAGNARFADDSQTVDTGVADLPEYGDIVDMGAYEYKDPYSGTLNGMTLPHVAYVHRGDEAAESFQSLIVSYGCSVTLLDVADAATAPLDVYDLIVIGSANYYFGENPETVAAIEHSGKPVLGLYSAGDGFFGRLGLDIGHPHGVWVTDQTSVEIIDPSNPMFSIPYQVNVPEDRVLQINTEATMYVGPHPDWIPQTVSILGVQGHGFIFCPLVMEQDRYVLWGFKESPLKMTEVGKLLFMNVLIRTANRAWGN